MERRHNSVMKEMNTGLYSWFPLRGSTSEVCHKQNAGQRGWKMQTVFVFCSQKYHQNPWNQHEMHPVCTEGHPKSCRKTSTGRGGKKGALRAGRGTKGLQEHWAGLWSSAWAWAADAFVGAILAESYRTKQLTASYHEVKWGTKRNSPLKGFVYLLFLLRNKIKFEHVDLWLMLIFGNVNTT